MPIPLDEYPIHQTPLPMDRVVTSDRNFYDRCYFNVHDRSGELFMVTGLGTYPNLGVVDAYAAVRIGDRQWSVKFSDALEQRGLDQKVGGYQIDVIEPLQRLRLRCQSPDGSLDFDLNWAGAFPAAQEEPHLMLSGGRPVLDASRFSQLGNWSGQLRVGDREFTVTDDRWSGARDRSWGIRPVGESEPAGRPAETAMQGFWWLYVPLQFSSCALVVIVQEDPDGSRTLSNAKRIWPDGRVEQLGWPRVQISYAPGTRHPRSARIHLEDRTGQPVRVDIETLTSVPLHIGAGYNGDPDWSHGRWMGRDWSSATVYDLTDPAVAGRIPWGVTDHLTRARMDGEEGWGMLEHATIGRHDPSGFADWSSVAPQE
ncbi:MAG TPA: hypothetical protein VNF47_01525 [Streptosporangiaceae bacterium]|nr:hypothetical protein [Streptosporangiaceae bacterium]